MKLDLGVEIYQSWYSDEGRVALPPHAGPGDEACVYIKRYCWRNLSQRPGAVTDSGRLGAGTRSVLWWPVGEFMLALSTGAQCPQYTREMRFGDG